MTWQYRVHANTTDGTSDAAEINEALENPRGGSRIIALGICR